MKRRTVVGLVGGTVGSLAGCASLVPPDSTETPPGGDCHCGHRGPPKGVLLRNEDDVEHELSVAVTDERGSGERVAEFTRTVEPRGRVGVEALVRRRGTYRVRAVLDEDDVSRVWTATTDQCTEYLLAVTVSDGSIDRTEVPCL